MRQPTPTPIPLFAGVFAPVLSLDALSANSNGDGGTSFDIRDDALCADEQLEQSQAVEAVADFVDSLPARDREIVKRLFWQDETQTQIAASFGVSKMAISKVMARIAKQGRAVLADHRHLTFSH